MDIHHIPLDQIDASALLRDRITLEPAPLAELQLSIATDGLRQPIEVFALSETGAYRYGLISGLRRLTAHRALRRPTIAAFLRSPGSVASAMAAMIAENDLRENLTPWERGLTLTAAVHHGLFDTIDAAILALHPTAAKQKRTRLRSLAMVVDELEGCFTTPELLSQSQIERLAAALRAGLSPLVHQILAEERDKSLPSQWSALLPTLTEALAADPDPTPKGPTRPRRLLTLKQGLTIRRELSRNGWLLRFSGPEARAGGLIDDVMDYVERQFGRE